MGRLQRDARLETREARTRLKPRQEPYWRQIHPGLAVGYYKGARGAAWFVRTHDGGRYRKRRLGIADDFADADGEHVLDYKQAHRLAIAKADSREPVERSPRSGYTVGRAVEDYLNWFELHRRSIDSTRTRCNVHILPQLGSERVADLTVDRLESWLEQLARTDSADPDVKRRRKASANRVLTILRAALTRAWRRGLVESDQAWRRVQPFRDVDQPVIRNLTRAEASRLLNSCDPDFRQLVHAALLTGCRYGELCALQCGDYNPDAGTVLVRHSKAGRARHVSLNAEGRAFFDELTAGRPSAERALRRASTEAWGVSHQKRRMNEACTRAKIDPPVSFHILRHTFGSLLALAGAPLQVIASAMGHSDSRMTERHYAHMQPDHVAKTIRAKLPTFSKAKPSKVRRIR